jgi:hypothetical protein
MRDPESDLPHFLRVVRALAKVKTPIASLAAVAAMSAPAGCSDGDHNHGVVFQPSGAGGAGGAGGFDGAGAGFGGFDGGTVGFDTGEPFDGGPVGVVVSDGGDPFDGSVAGVEAGPGSDGGP